MTSGMAFFREFPGIRKKSGKNECKKLLSWWIPQLQIVRHNTYGQKKKKLLAVNVGPQTAFCS